VWSKTVENFIFSIVAAYSKAAQRATPQLTFYMFKHKQLLLTTPVLDVILYHRYSNLNQLLEIVHPDETPENLADNPRTRYSYDAAGNQTSITDPDGKTTHYEYDALNRPTAMILPDDTPETISDNPRILTEYDQAGRTRGIVNQVGKTIVEYEYDAAGRQTLVRQVEGNETREITFVYDAVGQQIAATNTLGQTIEFSYNGLGQTTQVILPDGSTTKFEYDAFSNVIAQTDPKGQTTHFEYDAFDRLTAVIDPLEQRTEYGYDELGNLIEQQDAQGQITHYSYDALGRRTAVVLPGGTLRSESSYNRVGNLVSRTDFNGNTIEYNYDDRYRLISKNLPGETPFVEYGYTPAGQIETITDARGETSYQFDEQGLLLSRIEPDGTEISYTYNDARLIDQLTTPTGTTTYTYDELNRLIGVEAPHSENDTVYSYDLLGNIESITYGNGVVETRSYDSQNRLREVVQRDSNDELLSSYSYTFDAAGNIASVEELDGRRVEYVYDGLNRLVKEEIMDQLEGNRTIEYSYDGVGNRLSRNDSVKGLTVYSYDQYNRLISETTGSEIPVTIDYNYDNNGNLILANTRDSLEQVEYIWNAENRLVGVNKIDGQGQIDNMEYRYDANGIRVASIINGEETRYLIDYHQAYAGDNNYPQVVEEYVQENGTHQTLANYTYGLDLISQNREGEEFFYLADAHSGVRQLTDDRGQVTHDYSYDAYGNLLQPLSDDSNKYLYRGEQYDRELDLQYLRNRYYNLSTGRFISADQFEGLLDTPLSRHRYLYGHDNPVVNSDPTGYITLNEVLQTKIVQAILSNPFFAAFSDDIYAKAWIAGGIYAGAFYINEILFYEKSWRFEQYGGIRWTGSIVNTELASFGGSAKTFSKSIFGFSVGLGVGYQGGLIDLDGQRVKHDGWGLKPKNGTWRNLIIGYMGFSANIGVSLSINKLNGGFSRGELELYDTSNDYNNSNFIGVFSTFALGEGTNGFYGNTLSQPIVVGKTPGSADGNFFSLYSPSYNLGTSIVGISFVYQDPTSN